MASLFKPSIITYRLPNGAYRTTDGARVTKDTPSAIRTVEKSKKWYGRYTDSNGKPYRVPLSESKETARRMLAKLAGDAELAGVGIRDQFANHRNRPILEHLGDFERYLTAAGRVRPYVLSTISQCRKVITECHFASVDDLQSADVVEFLGRLRNRSSRPFSNDKPTYTPIELARLLNVELASIWRMVRRGQLRCSGEGLRTRYFQNQDVAEFIERRHGTGIETANHYLASIKQFSKWLVRNRRTAIDPLAYLSRLNADVDRRRQRRALRAETFFRLVEAAANGKPFRGISGADRAMLYTLAVNTGLRAGELASLKPASFKLDDDPATVTVEAGYSKHRREDVQPLRNDIATLLRSYLEGRVGHLPLWPGSWKDAAAEMLRSDLDAAGIPYKDDAGRYFDFHSLRGQFISSLAANGVHPKVAQILARHSTITLTMDYYTHLDVLDVAGALEKLPNISTQANPNLNKRLA